ncbi:cbb3-type cytochrome c oxidase subunit 3 [Zestomonas carbonaria]|uniref:Cbb3-type cytochrome c oxidase subunit 3 n=1 Tax=Zestomonas carbonaria TaxID=2762745 RepID=A0A7U7ESR7_9GAMM|nr:cbb3-type cytochrome c oxidase subunit 3 [Pseudomonas carbonaria]CAD5110492.1 hypothetical protein PSEWESI4_04815 [Pseudomonas carbonaria]
MFYLLFSTLLLVGFYVAVQWNLREERRGDIEEATMLPFADDPEVARRMELATGRSSTGCACPGTCNGDCAYWGRQDI